MYLDVSADRLRGSSFVDADIPKYVALNGFKFEFLNSDHKIRTITALRHEQNVQVNFQDHGGEDPYTVKLGYVDLSHLAESIEYDLVQGVGVTSAVIDLTDRPGKIPVLQGFSFDFEDNNDHHITEIAMQIQSLYGVSIAWNQGGFSLRTAFRDHQQQIPYSYQAQILWIPADRLRSVNHKERKNSLQSFQLFFPPEVNGRDLIQGFEFRYVNSDNEETGHFVKLFEFQLDRIDLNAATVFLTDDDRNTFFQACGDWATL